MDALAFTVMKAPLPTGASFYRTLYFLKMRARTCACCLSQMTTAAFEKGLAFVFPFVYDKFSRTFISAKLLHKPQVAGDPQSLVFLMGAGSTRKLYSGHWKTQSMHWKIYIKRCFPIFSVKRFSRLKSNSLLFKWVITAQNSMYKIVTKAIKIILEDSLRSRITELELMHRILQ